MNSIPRSVAVKQIVALHARDEVMARFRREAEVLAKVRHPCVVRVHELGRSPKGPYIVEELVEGETLHDLCAGGLEPRRAARLLRGLCGAVEAIHAAGILHRDLKPANVVVRRDGTPVLLDFGLARDADADTLTATGEVLGTPAYMPPEQVLGEADPTAAVDVYGLGALLYEMLVDRPPYEAKTSIEVMNRVLDEDPPSPAAARSGVPDALDAICLKAMAKEAADRYPTAAALRSDLDRFLTVGASGARRHRAVRRFLIAATLAAALLAAAAVGLAASTFAAG